MTAQPQIKVLSEEWPEDLAAAVVAMRVGVIRRAENAGEWSRFPCRRVRTGMDVARWTQSPGDYPDRDLEHPLRIVGGLAGELCAVTAWRGTGNQS